MDDREARFLASQAGRLAHRRPPPSGGAAGRAAGEGEAPPLVDEAAICNDNVGGVDNAPSKEQNHQFWRRFRAACSELQGQIDELLLLPPPSAEGGGGEISRENGSSNEERARAHYATAARRNEGRAQLDIILGHVRALQRHVLSSSSSVVPSSSSGQSNDGSELLQSILQNPMPEVTQTDTRLISQEIDRLLKRIEDVRGIICPKEKFVFRRYRRAMEERERAGAGVECSPTVEAAAKTETKLEVEKGKTPERVTDNLRSQYGGVLENMSGCTVEISADGTVAVNATAEEELQHYSSPQSMRQHSNAQESASYLLQHLQNVTVLLRGSRPSLHVQHVRDCKIYVAEPTRGPVHVTDCRDSEIRCSCHQLRVHESTDVQFHVWARSGPIIEDCNGMVFAGDYFSEESESGGGAEGGGAGRNMYWDVKDFYWLRALRKSPNFTVIERVAAGEDSEEKKREKGAATDESSRKETRSVEKAALVEEEDSEDEL